MADIDLPAWTIRPNWKGGILERLSWLTDVLTSSYGVEQRRSLRLSPRRSFEVDFTCDGNERTYLDLWLHRFGAQSFMLPLWHDKATLSEAVAVGATDIPIDTENREFEAGGLAIILGDAFMWDKVEVEAVAPDSITVSAGGVTRAWPAGTTVHPLRRARLAKESKLSALSSAVGTAKLAFDLDQSSDLADEGEWDSTYGDYPLLTQEPNWREKVDVDFQRMVDELDNEHGLVHVADDAGRAFTLQTHGWMLRGRSEQAAFRQLLYRLRGKAGAIWVPTFQRDLLLSQSALATDEQIDIRRVGYEATGGAVSGRRHILIDGSVTAQIDGTDAAPSDGEERLTLAAPLGSDIEAGAFASFLDTCRLAHDDIEILHHTDSDGAAECNLSFRAFRDERTEDVVIDYRIPASVKSTANCGAPAEGDSCVPGLDDGSSGGPSDGTDADPDEITGGGDPYDHALVEFDLTDMPDAQFARFTAVLAAPPETDSGTASDDGVFFSEIIFFPTLFGGSEVGPDSDTYYASLRVDLTALPAFEPVDIRIYAYVNTFTVWGGDGMEYGAETQQECLGTAYVGSLTRDYDGMDPETPDAILAAPTLLKLKSAYSGAANLERIIATFPELEGHTVNYSTNALQNVMDTFFQWRSDESLWREVETVTVSPATDPNAFIVYPLRNPEVYTYVPGYGPGGPSPPLVEEYALTRMPADGGGSSSVTIGGVQYDAFPSTNAETGLGFVLNGHNAAYYMPTWRYAVGRQATIRGIAVRGENPWTDASLRPNSGAFVNTWRWESPSLYPDRLPMPTIDSVEVPAGTSAELIGTVTIDRQTGNITFTGA